MGLSRTSAVTVARRAGLAGLVAPAAAGAGFGDVADDAWYAPAVEWAVASGVTTGTSADTFSPDDVVTRAQAVTFLYRAAGSPPTGSAVGFVDVPAGAWFHDAVAWAVAEGVTTGISPTTFAPSAPVTRAQVFTFVHRWTGARAVAAPVSFVDVPAGAWFHDAVAWALAAGLTTGTTPTTFSPDDVTTRAQMVTVLHRAITGGQVAAETYETGSPAHPQAGVIADLVARHNVHRAAVGCAALVSDPGLTGFAQAWADRMATTGDFAHRPDLGSAPGSWVALGENIAYLWGFPD
ncbi:MAG: S-layer homology domain-containing protein, partial [Acidimicrobiales bacterium]